jgi:uncharacterized Zn finger protein (UPF0148 family)
MKTCAKCDTVLFRKNKTGLCRAHWVEHTRTPEWRERVSRTQRRILFERPELKIKRQEVGRRMAQLPATVEARKRTGQIARERGYWKDGMAAANTPENRLRAARTCSERRLGWCPPELRDEYRLLITRHKVKAAEAREIILRQHETDMARFRRSIAG